MLKLKPLITEDQLNEAAPAQAILSAVELIRWEVLRNHPGFANWIKPKLRQIENAVKKIKRTGGQ